MGLVKSARSKKNILNTIIILCIFIFLFYSEIFYVFSVYINILLDSLALIIYVSGALIAQWIRRVLWKTTLRGCRVRFPTEHWFYNNAFKNFNGMVVPRPSRTPVGMWT